MDSKYLLSSYKISDRLQIESEVSRLLNEGYSRDDLIKALTFIGSGKEAAVQLIESIVDKGIIQKSYLDLLPSKLFLEDNIDSSQLNLLRKCSLSAISPDSRKKLIESLNNNSHDPDITKKFCSTADLKSLAIDGPSKGSTFIIYIISAFFLFGGWRMFKSMDGDIGVWFVAILLPLMLYFFTRSSRARRGRDGRFLLDGTRQYSLYLRSFSRDKVWSGIADALGSFMRMYSDTKSKEEHLLFLLSGNGPFLSVGRPGDHWPVSGANRVYFENEIWQSAVMHLMLRANYVVFHLDQSEGLVWELQTAIRLVAPEKIIIYTGFVRKNKKMCDKLIKIFQNKYDIGTNELLSILSETTIFHFDSNGKSIVELHT